MHRRQITVACALISTLSLSACAVNPTSQAPAAGIAAEKRENFSGRISLVIDAAHGDANARQSFSGGFELRGNAQIGELDLLSPLGQIVVRLRWRPDIAVILRGNQRQIFASAQDLIQQATGAALSLEQLMAWLEGKNTLQSSNDWQVDLSNYPLGRIVARRNQPTPAVLRLALDQP